MITNSQKHHLAAKTLIESVLQQSLLLERYVNVFDNTDKKKYVDDVWDILQSTYEPLGGFKTAASKAELIQKSWLWKLIRKNNKIVACLLYKKEFGRKSIACGSDGTPEGKQALKTLMQQDIKQKSSWGEFSGAAEHLIKKYGGAPIPVAQAVEILKKMGKEVQSTNPDGYHYTRLIQGKPYEKIMLGWLDI